MTLIEDYCIEVTRSADGCYTIPNAGTAERWENVQADMRGHEHYMSLSGWGRWDDVYRCSDSYGDERWYFVSDREVCSHCSSAGQDEAAAGLAEVRAYWVDEDGTSDETFAICQECLDAGNGQVPGYVLASEVSA